MLRAAFALVLPALALNAAPASAAVISWQSPTTITTADQALLQTGTVQYATHWGGASSILVTLTGGATVNFALGATNGTGNIHLSGAQGATPNTTTSLFSGTANTNFNSVLGGFAFDGPEVYTLTGLTIGNSYSVQIFSIDDRTCCGTKTEFFQDGNTSSAFAHNANDFIIGTFVATATTQSFNALSGQTSCSGTPGYCNVVNAVVLRNTSTPVPEPLTVALFGTGLFGLALVRRRSFPLFGS